MKIDYKKIIKNIKKEGIHIEKNLISKQKCKEIKNKLEKILSDRIKNKVYCGNDNYQVIDNYFMDDFSLTPIIFQNITDKVMKNLIDDDYVLISPSARNMSIRKDEFNGNKTSGLGWHTDSRFIQSGKGIKPSLCYMSILCIDEFKSTNGCTHYVPKSHLRYTRPKNRNAKLKYSNMMAPMGSIVFIGTSLWHRAGEPSKDSRWGVFNTYGPWFVKPYHRFNEMFSKNQTKNMPSKLKKLLHFTSTPPSSHLERMQTLQK